MDKKQKNPSKITEVVNRLLSDLPIETQHQLRKSNEDIPGAWPA
jgi:hypothetical protein